MTDIVIKALCCNRGTILDIAIKYANASPIMVALWCRDIKNYDVQSMIAVADSYLKPCCN